MLTLSQPARSRVVHVLDRLHPAADGERDRQFGGHGAYHGQRGAAPLDGSRNVEENQLVGPFILIPAGEFDRIAGIDRG